MRIHARGRHVSGWWLPDGPAFYILATAKRPEIIPFVGRVAEAHRPTRVSNVPPRTSFEPGPLRLVLRLLIRNDPLVKVTRHVVNTEATLASLHRTRRYTLIETRELFELDDLVPCGEEETSFRLTRIDEVIVDVARVVVAFPSIRKRKVLWALASGSPFRRPTESLALGVTGCLRLKPRCVPDWMASRLIWIFVLVDAKLATFFGADTLGRASLEAMTNLQVVRLFVLQIEAFALHLRAEVDVNVRHIVWAR